LDLALRELGTSTAVTAFEHPREEFELGTVGRDNLGAARPKWDGIRPPFDTWPNPTEHVAEREVFDWGRPIFVDPRDATNCTVVGVVERIVGQEVEQEL
jgi:hypothetical protein